MSREYSTPLAAVVGDGPFAEWVRAAIHIIGIPVAPDLRQAYYASEDDRNLPVIAVKPLGSAEQYWAVDVYVLHGRISNKHLALDLGHDGWKVLAHTRLETGTDNKRPVTLEHAETVARAAVGLWDNYRRSLNA